MIPNIRLSDDDQTFLQTGFRAAYTGIGKRPSFRTTQTALVDSREAEEAVRLSEARLSEALKNLQTG